MDKLVLASTDDGVCTLSLNRPAKHNALNDDLIGSFRIAVSDAMSDSSVRCLVLRGEGRSFCSGRDTSQLGQHGDGEPVIEWLERGQKALHAVTDSAKPVIVAMKGYVIGGGFEMSLAADIRIGAPSTRMSLPEVGLTSLPDNGATQLLPALIGSGRAKEVILAGRVITAEEGLQWGILNRLVPEEDLDSTVGELAREIASRSPLAIRLAKDLIDAHWAGDVRRGMRGELVAQTLMFGSADYAEGARARRSHGDPTYKGT